jgi:predicted outer membrane repeat protein
LLSASQFFVKSGSNILFRGNLAKQFGGAIYATKPALGNTSPSLNRRCFFSYLSLLGVDFPPHEWDVQVVFQDNTALEKGPSIYSSNFVDCRFFGRDVALPNATFQRSIFNIPPEYVTPFVFLYENGTRITDQEELNKQMASDAYELSVTPQEMEVRLGEEATFSVQATDELLYPTSAVFTVDTNLDIEPLGTAGSPYYFRVGGGSVVHSLEEKCSSTPTDRVCGERITETIVFNVQLQPLLKERTLTISQCYPGYRYDAKSSTCICEHDRIFELLRCSGGNKEFYVTEGVWVGFFRNKTELVIRVVPLTYLRCQQLQPEFPGCLASIDHQEEQCATGREGLLCGECRSNEGYGITMDFKYCSTYGCTGGGIALFFIVCGLVVIFCCFILYFNIPVPNELRGFFLFAQVIGLVYRHSGALNDLLFIEFIANLMGNSLPFPLCMHPYINTTWMAALSYIPPLLAFLTVVGFIIGARYSTRLAQRSTFKGIIFIILFTYKYITDASFILMNCVNVPDDNNPESYLWLSRFSGRACFGFPHLLWLIVALLLFVTVIVPTPLVMLLITCKHFNRTKHFSDALSKGFKRRARWFTAYDLLRRVYFVFFALWIPAIVLPNRVLSLAFFEIFMLVFHCLLLPYEKKWINMVEGLILVDLFVATVAILQPEDKYFPTGLIVVAIILPFLYALSASVYLISKYFWKRLSTKWRERITVQFGPLQHRWMKMKESFMQRESATAPPPEPIHATSMFYVNNTNDGELSASSGFDVPFSEIQDTNQYRTELNIS